MCGCRRILGPSLFTSVRVRNAFYTAGKWLRQIPAPATTASRSKDQKAISKLKVAQAPDICLRRMSTVMFKLLMAADCRVEDYCFSDAESAATGDENLKCESSMPK